MTEAPIAVEFPLRGEWIAIHTPAEKVPSHGTDYFGQRYAFDFARLDHATSKYYPQSIFAHLFGHVPSSSFHCWDQPVHSCFAGTVIAAADGWPDREEVNFFGEMFRASDIQGSDYRPLAGNYVVVQGDRAFAMYGHLRHGSVEVEVGRKVAGGDRIGTVGNSGNSTMPHLHFQLMDQPDPLGAAGVPCVFHSYERFEKDRWVAVRDGVPGALERVRK